MIVVVDNYDSFTYNLVQYLSIAGAEVKVFRNDAVGADELRAEGAAGIVLSPGPGRPEDTGVCVDWVNRREPVPLFGVCLGHQVIGHCFGGIVDQAPTLVHGKTSPVRHDGEGLFRGLDNPLTATRYHSLRVREESLPDELVPCAWSDDDGVLMAMRHASLPYWSVQFHPESILTELGQGLVENFLALCEERARG